MCYHFMLVKVVPFELFTCENYVIIIINIIIIVISLIIKFLSGICL